MAGKNTAVFGIYRDRSHTEQAVDALRSVAYVSKARRASARTYRWAGGSQSRQWSDAAGRGIHPPGEVTLPRRAINVHLTIGLVMVTRLNPCVLWGFGPHKFRAASPR